MAAVSLMAAVLMPAPGAGQEYEITAKIDSLRKRGEVTLLFEKLPEKNLYLVIEEKKVIGTVELYTVSPCRCGSHHFRALGRLSLARKGYRGLLRAGVTVGLVKKREPYKQNYSQPWYSEKKVYKKKIITSPDSREMVIVPAGKFILGSSHGDDDEKPEQVFYLKAFYIDRFEVSNGDYYRYMAASNASPPAVWGGSKYPEGEADYPVQVSWHEARAYAAWAGKRLPTEKEWEKAARGKGTGKKKKNLTALYPWGGKFRAGRCNGAPYWKAEAPKKKGGTMPVTAFEKKDISPTGAVNMAGNISEWTASWYKPYKGNYRIRGAYGTQYKVIRGGAWYSSRRELRVTNRKFGGIPDLYRDNTAGFRCVRDVTPGNLAAEE